MSIPGVPVGCWYRTWTESEPPSSKIAPGLMFSDPEPVIAPVIFRVLPDWTPVPSLATTTLSSTTFPMTVPVPTSEPPPPNEPDGPTCTAPAIEVAFGPASTDPPPLTSRVLPAYMTIEADTLGTLATVALMTPPVLTVTVP